MSQGHIIREEGSNHIYQLQGFFFIQVLKPNVSISCLKKWDYYTEETLATGPGYDWTMISAKCSTLDETDQMDMSPSHNKRKIVWPCYDNLAKVQPDAITNLFSVSVTV